MRSAKIMLPIAFDFADVSIPQMTMKRVYINDKT